MAVDGAVPDVLPFGSGHAVLDPATGARSANILFDVRGARSYARPPKGAPKPSTEVVGIRATDERTLTIDLEHRSPAFLQILALPAFCPVSFASMTRHGIAWTRCGNLVSNGPFRLEERRVRDRLHLVRNEHYWDRGNVALASMDILAATSLTTLVNLFFAGEVDWVTDVPTSLVRPIARDHPAALRSGPFLGTYFYRVNTTHPTLRNRKIRAALSTALDRRKIVATALAGGEAAAPSLVPPGIPGYVSPVATKSDPEGARALLGRLGTFDRPLLAQADDAHEPRRDACRSLQLVRGDRRLALELLPVLLQHLAQDVEILGHVLIPVDALHLSQLRAVDQAAMRQRLRVGEQALAQFQRFSR